MRPAFLMSVDVHKFLRTALAATASLCIGVLAGSFPAAAQSSVSPILLPVTISTIAGTGSNTLSGNGQLAVTAGVSSDLRAVAVDGQGNVYIADTGNNEVRKISAATGIMSVVAGGGTLCTVGVLDNGGDGCLAATQTVLKSPRGVAVDKAGNVYIAGYSDNFVHMVNAQTGIMSIVAGTTGSTKTNVSGVKGYSGDGSLATSASLDQPRGVRLDNFGNIWICDSANNVVRKVNAATGIITTAVGYNSAGVGQTGGYAGDGKLATDPSVLLLTPTDIVFDSQNNAYIADFGNKVIRKVTYSTGIISTLIGANGVTAPTTAPWGATISPIPANTALGGPSKLAIDSHDNLYFADSGASIIYFYDAVAKTLLPIAGEYLYAGSTTGFTVCSSGTADGDGCPATQALFYQGSSALGMTIDGQNNLYITDSADEAIRKVSTNLNFAAQAVGSTATTQNVELHFTPSDTASAVALGSNLGDFSLPSSYSCTTYSDLTTNCTQAVAYTPKYPGLRTAALKVTSVNSNQSFGLNSVGNAALQVFDPGSISTWSSALLSAQGMAYDAAGNLYIADTGNNRVVQINALTQAQTVIAGTGTAGYSGDGAIATSAKLSAPTAVVVGIDGKVYIADTGNSVVRVVNPVNNFISTFAGGAAAGCTATIEADSLGDGCPATEVALNAPSGLAIAANGNLYIADTGNNAIRRVDQGTGVINLFAGSKTTVACSASTPDAYGDGCQLISTSTIFSAPSGLASDASGNIYVADTGHNIVRMLNPSTGLVTVVAGDGQASFSGDTNSAVQAALNAPKAVAVDAAGNLYIADTGNAAIRMVNSASGYITTLLGLGGTTGSTGGSGLASELLFSAPSGVAVDAAGDVAVSDTSNKRVVVDDRNAALIAYGLVNTNPASSSHKSQDQTATVNSIGNVKLTFSNTPFLSLAGNTGEFYLDTATCVNSGSLAIGASCNFAEYFEPTISSTVTEVLTIPSNAVNTSSAYLDFTGQGKLLTDTTTTLTLTSPASGSIQYGDSATFTVTVAPKSGSGIPTGTIIFSVNGTNQPAVLLSSTGTSSLTLTMAQLPVGASIAIGATYSGDTSYASSFTTLSESVSPASTTTTLTITPSTTIQGNSIAFKALVSSTTVGIPTGSVNFNAGSTLLGSAALDATGLATFNGCASTATVCSIAVGSYSVTAVYVPPTTGTIDFTASTSSAVSLTVNSIPAGMIVSASPTVLSVPQGGSVQSNLIITPMGGLTGTVTLNCTGLPSNSNCTFYPTTLNLGGSPNTVPTCTTSGSAYNASVYATANAVCTTLTITTNVPPAALNAQLQHSRSNMIAVAALLPVLLFGCGGLFSSRKRKLPWMMAIGVLMLAGLTMLPGCVSNVTQEAAGVTPTGTSTVTVTLTGSNGVTQSIPFTLTIVQATAVTAQVDQHMALPALAAMQVGSPSAQFGF